MKKKKGVTKSPSRPPLFLNPPSLLSTSNRPFNSSPRTHNIHSTRTRVRTNTNPGNIHFLSRRIKTYPSQIQIVRASIKRSITVVMCITEIQHWKVIRTSGINKTLRIFANPYTKSERLKSWDGVRSKIFTFVDVYNSTLKVGEVGARNEYVDRENEKLPYVSQSASG
jgi:hypothetical protein